MTGPPHSAPTDLDPWRWPVAKDAAKALVKWIKSPTNKTWAANSNYTVAVYRKDALVVTKVGGMAGGSAPARVIMDFIIAKEINVGRKLYWAGAFNAFDGPSSNHAEMCILAACGASDIGYIECTSPNCIFCKATLEDYGLAEVNGNAEQGVGKAQIGWRHPYKPLTYGSAIAPESDALQELREVNEALRNKRPLPRIRFAIVGFKEPKPQELRPMELKFPTGSDSEEDSEGEGENDVSASEEESKSESDVSVSEEESEG